MKPVQNALEVLDHDFLDVRKNIVDIAATLDRIGATAGAETVRGDPRWSSLHDALRILTDGEQDRARRIQMTFSDSYNADWRGK